MEYVVIVLLLLAVCYGLVISIPGLFSRCYDRAMIRDLAWAREHPDYTLEEAHRHRRRVRRLFFRP